MIKINLLPQEMVGSAKSGGAASAGSGTALVVFVLLIIFAVDIALGGYLWKTQSDAQRELTSVNTQYAAVKKSLDDIEITYNQTKMDIERMQKLIQVAESLAPQNRLLWARKLNMLPTLVPEGVFLTEINTIQKVKEVETEESVKARNEWNKNKGKNKGPIPAQIKIPVLQQTLTLKAIAYVPDGTSTQRLQQLNAFYKNLQSKKVKVPFDREPKGFMEGFLPTISPSSLLGKNIEGRDVSVFSFTILTTPLQVR